MRFQRTAASMFQSVKDLHIEREHEIAELLQTYEAEQESAACPDRTLLSRACARLEERLEHHPLDRELVELGHSTYRSLGAWQQEIVLLRRYLSTHPDPDEQAWARWHIVDCLSLAGNVCEAVEEQQALFQWARKTFPLEDCFFVIADGTQARSWLKGGRGNHWLQLAHQLLDHAPTTAHNRLDRFYCLRTEVHLCLELGEIPCTRHVLGALYALEQEDPTWREQRWIKIEIALLEMVIAGRSGDIEQVRALAGKALEALNEWEQDMGKAVHPDVGRFRSLCHNLAAPLYRAKQYDLAIPLFQKAIDYKTNPHYAYLWLAASLWQTTHQWETIFPLLQQAAARYDGDGNPWERFRTLPEFEDVQHWNDSLL